MKKLVLTLLPHLVLGALFAGVAYWLAVQAGRYGGDEKEVVNAVDPDRDTFRIPLRIKAPLGQDADWYNECSRTVDVHHFEARPKERGNAEWIVTLACPEVDDDLQGHPWYVTGWVDLQMNAPLSGCRFIVTDAPVQSGYLDGTPGEVPVFEMKCAP